MELERERETETFHLWVHFPHGWDWGDTKPGAFSGSLPPHDVAGASELNHQLLSLQGYQRGTGLEMEQLSLEWLTVWCVSTIGSSPNLWGSKVESWLIKLYLSYYKQIWMDFAHWQCRDERHIQEVSWNRRLFQHTLLWFFFFFGYKECE